VTPMQADWLERYELNQEQIDHYIDMQPLKKRPDSPIVDWPASKLAKALYIGYEIKKGFEVGDWVYNEEFGLIGQITKIEGVRIWAHWNDDDKEKIIFNENLRHATPQEITEEKQCRWWAKHGREVWELRKGDVLKSENTRLIYGIADVKDSSILFVNESKFKTKNMIKRFYKVLCFAEQRLDTEGNNYD